MTGVFFMPDEKYSIERAAFPEEVGVSSAAIAEFIQDLNEHHIEMHSMMILRDGKVAYECWREPYGPDIPHTMYSVSKSVTSAAVGFAVEEGLLSLDTKVIDIFPGYRPKKRDEWLEKMTVWHLLTMTAGKDVGLASDKAEKNWTKEFFDAGWAFEPGTSWRYISEDQYMLSAIINKVTGMNMVDYLMPRLFEPLGISRKPFWEKSAEGIEAGGWGLFLTTEECARFILCYSRGGMFGGKQVIPAKWAQESVKKLVDNRRDRDDEPDTGAGYGYCFWRNACPDSYRADGMFSQFGIVFEKLDAVIVVTSCEMNERKTRECIFRHFPEGFIQANGNSSVYEELKGKLILDSLGELPKLPRSRLEKAVSGKTIRIKKPKLLNTAGYPVSMIPLPVLYMGKDKAGNIDKVSFIFSADECVMNWSEGEIRNSITCGMDGKARKSTIKLAGFELTANSSAAWENEHTLCVWMRPLEAICQRRLRFIFSGNHVKVLPSTVPDSRCMLDYVSERIKIYVRNPAVSKIGETAVTNSIKIVEPAHRGKVCK